MYIFVTHTFTAESQQRLLSAKMKGGLGRKGGGIILRGRARSLWSNRVKQGAGSLIMMPVVLVNNV